MLSIEFCRNLDSVASCEQNNVFIRLESHRGIFCTKTHARYALFKALGIRRKPSENENMRSVVLVTSEKQTGEKSDPSS